MVRVFTLTLDGVEQKFAALNYGQVEHFSARARELRDKRDAAEKAGQPIDVEAYKQHMLEIVEASLKAAEPDGEWVIDKLKELDKGLLETLYDRILEKSRMVPIEGAVDRGEVRAEGISRTHAA